MWPTHRALLKLQLNQGDKKMARGEFLLRPAGLLSGLFGYLGGNGVYMVLLLLSHVVLGLLGAYCMQRLA